jgi:hypothetical protein
MARFVGLDVSQKLTSICVVDAQALQCPQRAHTEYVRPNGHPRSLPAPSPRWAAHHPRLCGGANVSLQDKVRDFAGPRRSGARWLR